MYYVLDDIKKLLIWLGVIILLQLCKKMPLYLEIDKYLRAKWLEIRDLLGKKSKEGKKKMK